MILVGPFPPRFASHSWEGRELSQSPSQTRYLRTHLYFISFNIKGGREGPQLSTWPLGSTSVRTVIKYLEAAEKSGKDLK